jgi:hypothetical protein
MINIGFYTTFQLYKKSNKLMVIKNNKYVKEKKNFVRENHALMKALYVCLLNNGEAFCCTYVHIL